MKRALRVEHNVAHIRPNAILVNGCSSRTSSMASPNPGIPIGHRSLDQDGIHWLRRQELPEFGARPAKTTKNAHYVPQSFGPGNLLAFKAPAPPRIAPF